MNGKQPRVSQGEGRLWVKWVLANAAGLVMAAVGAVILALALGVEPEALNNTHFFRWFYALLLGSMQWLVLRQRGFRFYPWVVATTAGAILYSVLITATWSPVWSRYSGVWVDVAAETLFGAAMGVTQWLLLRRRFSRAGWWILATAVGFALESALVQAPACLALLFLLVPGALTGIVLVRLFRQPFEAVEILPSSVRGVRPEKQTCAHCGEQVSSRAISCRHCGGRLVDSSQAVEAAEKKPAQELFQAVRHGRPRGLVWALGLGILGGLAAIALPIAALVTRAMACGPLHSSVFIFAPLALAVCVPGAALPAALVWIMGRRRSDGSGADAEDFSFRRALAGGLLGVSISFAASAVCALMIFFPECL